MEKKRMMSSELIDKFIKALGIRSTVLQYYFKLGVRVGLYFYFWKEFWRHQEDAMDIMEDMQRVRVPDFIRQVSDTLMDVFVEVD